ncbi:SDR family NAD(P)-dependent oxidoreductase, partial [Mycobacterium kansasii]
AVAIERSVRWNLATVPVGWEAWAAWYIFRLSPGVMRALTAQVRMPLADKFAAVSGKILGAQR